MSRNFLFATFGSLGDLHPPLAVGIELQRRGHHVTIASHGGYRARVEREGLGFVEMPPDFDLHGDRNAMMERAMHPTHGSFYIIKELILPFVAEGVRVLEAAAVATGADALVCHPITFAVPIVAEKRGLPWFGTSLQPVTMMSACDPANPPFFTGEMSRAVAPTIFRISYALMQLMTRGWMKAVDAARVDVGLKPKGGGFEVPMSRDGNLAMFSRVLQAPQPDWPPLTEQTGFAFFDRPESGPELPDPLPAFLDAGPPPIVFTLGSSAIYRAGNFYEESARAARALGRRAVLLIGDDVIAVPYASYSALFPRARAIVHQGGSGTTGQALRAGKPQIVVPFSHDQPDHAVRITRAGVGARLTLGVYRASRIERTLARLLGDSAFAERAEAVGRIVRTEPGAAGAAEALERMLERRLVSAA